MSRLSHASVVRAAVLGTALLASKSLAVTHVWNGGNVFGPSSMNVAGNWSGGVPVSGSANLTLIFPLSPANNAPNQNIINPLELQSLQINGFYNLSGNAFRFNNLGAAPSLTNANGFAMVPNAMQFVAPTTVTTDNNTLSLTGSLTGGVVTFGSSISSGANTITLAGGAPNSIAAVVTNNATLDLQKANAVASSLTLNGGTMTTFIPNSIASNTNLTVNSPAVPVNLSNTVYMNPAIRLTSASQTVNLLTLNSGQIDIQTSFLTVAGPIVATGNSALVGIGGMTTAGINLNGAVAKIINTPSPFDSLIIDGTILNGTFNKTGAGTLDLRNGFSGGSSFTGQNVVSAGKLKGEAAAIGNDVLNNSVVELTGGAYTGTISGSGSVVIANYVVYQSLNTYTGGTTINNGAFLDAQPQFLHGAITGAIGSSLQLTHTTNQTLSATLAGSLFITKSGAGVVTLPNSSSITGSTSLSDGGINFAANNALGSSQLFLGGGPSTPVSLEGVGTVTQANPLFIAGPVIVQGGGNLGFTNAAAKNTNYSLVHNSTGNTTIAGKFTLGASGSITANNGALTLGDPAVVGGFVAAGPIDINSGATLTLRSFNFISLPDVTLAGGTLNTPNGYAIPLGAALQGNGGVTGRVASANGSTILATGGLTLGDAAHPAGVNLDGELYTNQFAVVLSDSNQGVLGSLTRIGSASANGSLASANGLIVNFGRNLTGRGVVGTGNTLAQASIINGDVNGDGTTFGVDALEFTGYVKGVGTFNNAYFSGTFAPGLSPALLTVGSIGFTPSNILDMEIGGLNRGSQYDAIDATTNLMLGGTLKISLINSFMPAIGDQFNLFDGPMTGVFSGFNFAPLTSGVWDTSLLYSQGIVQVVVPEPTAIAAVALGVTLLRRRR